MKINIYVSERDNLLPSYGFLLADKPVSLLPGGEPWRHVRSIDTADLNLPEVVEEEMERSGFWAFGGLARTR